MNKAQSYVDTAVGYAAGFGLTPDDIGVYMQPLERGRACHLSFSFPCDLSDEKDRARTKELHFMLSEKLLNDGAFFSRPYGTGQIWSIAVPRPTLPNSRNLNKFLTQTTS